MSRHIFDEWTQKIQEWMPENMKNWPEDMRQQMSQFMQTSFQKMDLVTREEFDIQQNMLLKSRELLEALEARVAQLEEQLKQKN